MAFKIAEAFVEIKGDKGKFSGTIRSAKKETSGFAASATKSLKKVAIGLAAISVAATAAAVAIGVKLTRAILSAGRAALLTAVKYDKLTRGLTAVAGSSEEAQRQMIRLRKVAELPGLSFEAVLQGSINLQAAELNARLAERSMLAFGNALVTVGRGAEELKRANLQITQIATKTRGFGADIRVLREIVPQVGPALRRAFDNKPIEELSVTGIELIEGLIAELEKLPKAAGGIANSIENIGISFDLLKAQIGKAIIPATETALKSLTDIIEKLTLVIKHYGDYKDEAAQVFREVALIGATLTTELVSGMIKIIAESAQIVWVPLKFAMIKVMAGIRDEAEIGLIKLFAFIGRQDKKITALLIRTVKTNRITFDALAKQMESAQFDKALREGLLKIEAQINSTFDTMMERFGEANTVLDNFVGKIPEKAGEAVKTVSEAVDGTVISLSALKDQDLGFLTDTTEADRVESMGRHMRALHDNLNELIDIAPHYEIASKQIRTALLGWMALGEPGKFPKLLPLPSTREFGENVAAYERMWSEIKGEQRSGFTALSRRVSNWKRAWKGFAVETQQTFTNAFAEMLDQGETDWRRFALNLKKIFLRTLAEIVVSEAFRGIGELLKRFDRAALGGTFSGGGTTTTGGGGGTNTGAVLTETGEKLEENLAPGAVNVIIETTDIEHMSQARIERAVRRQIVPALRNMQKQGLIPTRR